MCMQCPALSVPRSCARDVSLPLSLTDSLLPLIFQPWLRSGNDHRLFSSVTQMVRIFQLEASPADGKLKRLAVERAEGRRRDPKLSGFWSGKGSPTRRSLWNTGSPRRPFLDPLFALSWLPRANAFSRDRGSLSSMGETRREMRCKTEPWPLTVCKDRRVIWGTSGNVFVTRSEPKPGQAAVGDSLPWVVTQVKDPTFRSSCSAWVPTKPIGLHSERNIWPSVYSQHPKLYQVYIRQQLRLCFAFHVTEKSWPHTLLSTMWEWI